MSKKAQFGTNWHLLDIPIDKKYNKNNLIKSIDKNDIEINKIKIKMIKLNDKLNILKLLNKKFNNGDSNK